MIVKPPALLLHFAQEGADVKYVRIVNAHDPRLKDRVGFVWEREFDEYWVRGIVRGQPKKLTLVRERNTEPAEEEDFAYQKCLDELS